MSAAHISLSLVNQQIAAAKEALGVRTANGAIYKAFKEGLID